MRQSSRPEHNQHASRPGHKTTVQLSPAADALLRQVIRLPFLNVGARSVLYGAHQFLLHPRYVRLAWEQLYGPVRDPRLHLSFFLHDIGYLIRNTPDMDGKAGEDHVLTGAAIMGHLFGAEWEHFMLCHSRFYARRIGSPVSRLGVADKLAPTLEDRETYLRRTLASGELWEYLWEFCYGKYGGSAHLDLDLNPAHLHARIMTPEIQLAAERWYDHTMNFLREYAYTYRELCTREPT